MSISRHSAGPSPIRACPRVQRSDGFVVQTGDPAAEGRGEAHGYVPASGGGERRIPLEVIVKGDKQPMYGATFDEDGRGGYAPRGLGPLNIARLRARGPSRDIHCVQRPRARA